MLMEIKLYQHLMEILNYEPNGTGDVRMDTDQVLIGGGSEVQYLLMVQYDLKLVTNSGTDSSYY